MRLNQKVAIITGIGSGMGQAAAKLFAAEGALVVGCDIDRARCDATVKEILSSGGQAVALGTCDPSEPEQAQQLIDLAMDTHGFIDVLYNNAAAVHFAPI
jgi:NAD(P)-dependent dehydrogenase (short-subunit alcohol dehydrogenase family)